MSAQRGDWGPISTLGPAAVTIDGIAVRAGSRVRCRPRPGGDVLDIALAGREATVAEVLESTEGIVHLAVTIDDDPGRDLGEERQIGHRFFFTPAEVEPLGGEPAELPPPRILVAGIGNVFLADDGFGVAVAERLAQRELPERVHVEDYGIRGMDLAYALHDYDVALLVDATPRGEAPGTLYVIEPDLAATDTAPEAHGMDPIQVLALAHALGGRLPRVLVVGCEPQEVMTGAEDEIVAELSGPVRAAVDEAARLVESLVQSIREEART